MSRFKIPCGVCGEALFVGIAQAGASASCPKCGGSTEVPGTKQLRAHHRVDASDSEALDQVPTLRTAGSSSLVFRGIAAGLLAISALCLTYGGYLAYLRWAAPIEFGHTEEELFTEIFDRSMADPPARVWDHWNYLVDQGVPDPDPPIYFLLERQFSLQKPWMIGSLSLGSLTFLAFVVVSVVGGRNSRRN